MKWYRDLVIGGINRSEIWATGPNAEIQFVDGDFGVGADGVAPKRAVNTITKAVNNITGRGATIYVRPRGTAAGVQTYYADNITIPVAKSNMKILGAGADLDNPYYGVDVKASTVSSPVITIQAPGVVLEGIRLAGTGQDAAVSIVYAADNASTVITAGLTIRNCRFGNARGHGAAAAAVYLNSSWMNKIENCIFTDCLTGIAALTTSGGITQGLKIKDCEFSGLAANRDVDIYISGGSTSNGLLIKGCDFNVALPAHADGSIKLFIDIVNAISGMICDCNFAVSAANADGLLGAAGTGGVVPAAVLLVNNHYEGAATQEGLVARYT